ncbi:hypothetical protein FH972_001257 [Carpinus fangiana]|uniref:DCD domain-containing protein n=1 Tax=Carpinus fangiana TaxID=176857 RepID=A0A5N6QED7_9ROSI|nr:hypothetical protein FH972_001257 [Carpinus fangiana]
MDRGRKKVTRKMKEISKTRWTVNCSVTARNLRKSDLCGVIFGCTYNTINECYSKQLFGLPAPHFSYVENVGVGLPLFLFNYSDRKLHGVFEAASPGQLNIDPYGWTSDGSNTPYAAQVKFRIRMHCQPLLEDQFKPVIAENYFKPRLFWFELDQDQTKKLISLFSSSPVIADTSLAGNTQKWGSLFKASSVQEGGSSEVPALEWNAHTGQASAEWESRHGPDPWGEEALIDEEAAEKDEETGDHDRSYASVMRDVKTSCPQKKWSDLCKDSNSSTATRKVEDFKTPALELKLPSTHQSNMKRESSGVAPCLDGGCDLSEAAADDWGVYNDQLVGLGPNSEVPYSSAAAETSSFPQRTSYETEPTADKRREVEGFKTAALHSHLAESNIQRSCVAPSLDIERQFSKVSIDEGEAEKGYKQNICPKPSGKCSSFSSMNREMLSYDTCLPEEPMDLEIESSEVQFFVAELQQENRELKLSHLKQVQTIDSLEQDLVESRREIQSLKERIKMVERGSFPEIGLVTEKEVGSSDESHSDLDKKVLIAGGYDGSLWLPAFDCYSPFCDLIESLCPMSFVRSHASAAKLNGEVYLFGGAHDTMWCDTVESYNPLSDKWVTRPSLNQKKGGLGAVSLNQKIFAIGGGVQTQCFSEVEIFDLDIGRWIPTRPMLQKRSATAAAEINGTIYVVGGYDGENYLKSVERFDPREQSWTILENMSTSRASHSLVVLNDKLYAVGGQDGNRMVSSVEIFDPRVGSWMMGESLNDSRAYAGAAVISDSIYVIGGVNKNQGILDTVECYKEGHGWQLTNLKGVGKRGFFSAIVL